MAKQVACDSCRRSFLVPDEIGDFWVLCPYCQKVNPRAQVELQKTCEPGGGSLLCVFGAILLILGILGGLFSSTLFAVAINWGARLDLHAVTWLVITLFSSGAFIVGGIVLIRVHSKGGFQAYDWPVSWILVLCLVVGISGWIVFATRM